VLEFVVAVLAIISEREYLRGTVVLLRVDNMYVGSVVVESSTPESFVGAKLDATPHYRSVTVF
jgi:hypothetical protein